MPKTPGPTRPTLLLAVDFSPASRKALRMGLAFAVDLGAKVRLVHALSKPARRRRPGAGGRQVAQAVGQAEAGGVADLCAEWAGELRDAGLDVQVATPAGPAAQAILDEAAASGASLIVLGTEGAGGLRRLLVGSVAQDVIRRSPVPVLVAPARLQPEPEGRRKARPSPGRPILVAVDLNDEARDPVEAARVLAKDLGAPLRLLYTVTLPSLSTPPLEAGTAYTADMVLRDEEEAAIALTALAEPLRQSGLKVQNVVRVGEPATALLADGDEAGAALIVVGTHGRSALRKAFLGSVAQKVVRTSNRPVLIVPVAAKAGRKAAAGKGTRSRARGAKS